MNRDRIAQFLRFALVGASGVPVNVAVLDLWLWRFPDAYLAAQVAGWSVAVTTNWWLNRRFTFAGARTEAWFPQWTRFVAVNAAGGLVGLVCYGALLGTWPLCVRHPELASLIGIAAGLGFNFVSSKLLVFSVKP